MNMLCSIKPDTRSSAWLRAWSALQEAEAAYARFCAEVSNPAQHEYWAQRPSVDMTLEVKWGAGSQTYILQPADFARLRNDELVGATVARKEREWHAAQQAEKALRERLNLDAIDRELYRLEASADAARDALLMTPAPDLPALHWKLSETIRAGEGPAGEIVPHEDEIRLTIVDDYQRLLPI